MHSMLRALVGRGHEVHVWLSYYTDSTERYELDGVQVHPRTPRDLPDWSRPDVIVSHLENVPVAARMAMTHSKPFVNVVHNTHAPTKMMLAGKTDLIVYNSEWMADECGRRPNSIVVRPPVIAEDYRTTPGRKVTLVNLNENKGGNLFWDLAAALPDVEFLGVVGAYGAQVVKDGFRNVEIREHGPDMREVYASSRLVLMPSEYESWGRVGVEAIASGIPVLCHPTPGLREAQGAAGIFLSRDYPEAWVETIRTLMTDEAEWRKASRKALKRSKELDPAPELARWCDEVERLVA